MPKNYEFVMAAYFISFILIATYSGWVVLNILKIKDRLKKFLNQKNN